MKKRISVLLSLLLCAALCLSMIPFTALAENDVPAGDSAEAVDLAETPAQADPEIVEDELTESEEPMELVEPTENTEAEESAEPMEPIDNPEPEEIIEPEEPIDNPEPEEIIEPEEPIENIEPAEPTEPVGNPEPDEPTEPAEPVENPEPGELSEPTEAEAPADQTVYAERVDLDNVSASLDALEELRLTATVSPETADQTVYWTSSNPAVADVDDAGLVIAIGRGAAVITATAAQKAADGSDVFAECAVTVRSDGSYVYDISELASAHPYSEGESRFWEYTLEGSDNLALTFAPETAVGSGDFLILQFGDNQQYSYSVENMGELAGHTVAISGNTVRIWLVSDHDGNTAWGFQVTNAAQAGENDNLTQGQNFSDPLAEQTTIEPGAPERDSSNTEPETPGGTNEENGGEVIPIPESAQQEDTDPTASVSLSQNQLELEALDTATLTATMTSADAAKLNIHWMCSDETTVEIVDFTETGRDETAGMVTGTCTIRALRRTAAAPTMVTATAVTIEDGEAVQDLTGTMQAASSCTVTVVNDAVVVTDWTQLESEHPYYRPIHQFWQYTDPNAENLTLTFDPQTAAVLPTDSIIVTDGSKNRVSILNTGNLLAGQTLTVYDNTVRIYLESAESGTGSYGFKISNVYASAAQNPFGYSVTYYANGGTNPPEKQSKEEGKPLTLTTDEPTRSHYRFLGWATERNSGRVAWYPGDVYDVDADLILYAVWERVSTFDSTNRGSSSTPYYGPTGTTTETQSYPQTPIELERSEADYDKEVLHIRTVEDLIAFSENCSLDTWSDRLPVVLDNDLSLSDVDFQPIPLFNGSFDGRGHSIFDLSITDPMAPCGLFLETGRDALIKNLSVTGTVTPGGENNMTGGLVGLNRGCLLNCSFTGTVAGKSETGGLAGRNEITGLITGCQSSSTVSGLSMTGGICGINYGTLITCYSGSYVNTESVDPSIQLDDIDTSSLLNFVHSLTTETAGITTDTGGICGYNEGFIEHCTNNGPVGYSRLGYNVGGVAGRSRGYINAALNDGVVYGRKDVGGIAGQAEPYIEVSQAQNLTAGLSYRLYALHQSIDDAIHDAEVLSDDIAGQLSGLSGFLIPVEQAFREISILDLDSVLNLRGVIVDTVSNMAGQLQSMSASVGEGSDVITEDLQAVSDNLNAFSGSALQTVDLLTASQNDEIIVDDSASAAADAITLGKTSGCHNNGEISGESNVGGIVGVIALEDAMDPELELTSTNQVLRNRYSYRSVVSRSVNHGAVSAWYECAGGIAGKADIGYITNCSSYSSVSISDGAYAGGIVGLSYGTVQNCVARCSLSGTKYVGGILGNGYTSTGKDDKSSQVSSCYSLVDIQERPQFSGAISGGAEGEYSENYFVPAGFAGLNKLSVLGQAEPILFSVFNSVLSLPEESKTFTLRFVVEGETVKEVNFEYGASFTRDVFPVVANRDGAYAVWDRTDLTDLRFDTTVTAEYRRSETALGTEMSRENGRPVAYVIGQFQEGDRVTAEIQPIQADEIRQFRSGWLQTAVEQIRSIFHEPDYSICVSVTEKLKLSFPEDGLEKHTVHYMAPDGRTEDYRLYLKTAGGYERLPEENFGSYYSFEVESNSPEICLVETVQSWWFLLYFAGALLVLCLVIVLLTRIVRKLKARPGKPKNRKKWSNVREKLRRHRKPVIITGAILLGMLLTLAILLQTGWLQAGFAGYRVLKGLTREELDMATEIRIRAGEEEISLSGTAQQISQDGEMILCADQYGIDLYIANGTLYLENGRAFRLVNEQVDQRHLLRLALNAVRKGQVTKSTPEPGLDCYSTVINSKEVEEILAQYINEDLDTIYHGDMLQGQLDVRDGVLSEIRLIGEGKTQEGTILRLEATIVPQPLTERKTVPQTVMNAIKTGGKADALMTGDMLELFAAWIKNDRARAVDATIEVRAQGGILSIDDTYSYFRQNMEKTNIHCVSDRLFRVYFTDEASCNSAGQVLSTAEMRLLDSAKLIPIVRELFLKGNYVCEDIGNGKKYTLTIEQEEVADLVTGIIPEMESLNIDYEDCTLSATVRDGELYSLELECGGTVRIVTKDVEASAGVIVRFEKPQDHTIPTAVKNTLLTTYN